MIKAGKSTQGTLFPIQHTELFLKPVKEFWQICYDVVRFLFLFAFKSAQRK